jgi:hypothetical protein
MIPANPVAPSNNDVPAPVMLSLPSNNMIPLQPGSNVMVPQQPQLQAFGGGGTAAPQTATFAPQQAFYQQPNEAIQPVNALHPFVASALGNTGMQKYQPTPLGEDNGHIYIDGPFQIVGWSAKSLGIVGPAMANYGNLIPMYTGIPSKNMSKNIGKRPDGTGAQEGYWFPRSQLNEMSAKISALNQKITSGEINNPEMIGSLVLSGAAPAGSFQQAPPAGSFQQAPAAGSFQQMRPAFTSELSRLPEITNNYPNHFVTDKGIEYRALLTTVPVPVVGRKIAVTFKGTAGKFEYSIVAVDGLTFTVEGYDSKLEVKLINLQYNICNQAVEHSVEFI